MAVVRLCDVAACGKIAIAKKMCAMHYYRVRKHGDPNKGGINVTGKGVDASRLPCSIVGCGKPSFSKTVCKMHYGRMRRHGDPAGGRSAKGGVVGRIRPAICTIPGCVKPHQSLGYCATHYQRHRDGRVLEVPVVERASKGEKYLDGNGYVVWTERGHPCSSTSTGRVLEHRAVLAEKLGRSLLPGENAHHRNGCRSDNRPENLELWVTLQPSGQRPEDLLQWADEIIARYRPQG